jgi:S1-C subfamily serine protease
VNVSRAFLPAALFLALATDLPAASPPSSLVRLRVAHQDYSLESPWKKDDEESRSGYGCVLSPGRILATADMVRSATLIRVEKGSSGESVIGRVEIADYEIDLAVIAVEETAFFNDLTGVDMEAAAAIDQPVKFLVFEQSKELREIPGHIVRIALDDYYFSWFPYLAYGAAVNFEDRGGGWSEPVFSGEKLIGITMSYNGERQYAQVIPVSVIRRFLDGIGPGGYRGFARLGFSWTPANNPDFRRYLRLPSPGDGVYIDRVTSTDSPLRRADVLLSLDGNPIDSEGYWRHRAWGKIACPDIVQRGHFPGETVPLVVSRDGRRLDLNLILPQVDPESFLVPCHPSDRPPRYLVVGGLVIQELTRDYLKTWGNDWKEQANKKFLYNYYYRAEDPRPGRERIVILSQVLPDEANTGYQDLVDLVISRVNGQAISRLEDVATALRSPLSGFHRFEFEEHGRRAILDAETLTEADSRIAERYHIPSLIRLDN